MNQTRQIAFYGKGGIGKSTIASNVAASLAERGLTVMMIGCDPKSDSTRNIRGDDDIPTVLDVLREKETSKLGLTEIVTGKKVAMDEVVHPGWKGILCVEAGGPEPAVGCAGRGIILAVELLRQIGAFDTYRPDVVIYDVLGDVVCGGFGMPLRQGLADEVYIVTSADYLSIYAANNICKGISRHTEQGGSPLGGIIYNVRGALDDMPLVDEFARRVGSRVVAAIENDSVIMESEIFAQTTIAFRPESGIADRFRILAGMILDPQKAVSPQPLSRQQLSQLAKRIRQKTKETGYAPDQPGPTAAWREVS